jgi:hypothetical protein
MLIFLFLSKPIYLVFDDIRVSIDISSSEEQQQSGNVTMEENRSNFVESSSQNLNIEKFRKILSWIQVL